jgi:hypothetical protein
MAPSCRVARATSRSRASRASATRGPSTSERLLRVGLPEQRFSVVAPVAQRIAARRLDLYHLGAEVAELERGHVAGDEAREVEHAHAVERPLAGGIEGDRGEGRTDRYLKFLLLLRYVMIADSRLSPLE